jgi:hypothetical protein
MIVSLYESNIFVFILYHPTCALLLEDIHAEGGWWGFETGEGER